MQEMFRYPITFSISLDLKFLLKLFYLVNQINS